MREGSLVRYSIHHAVSHLKQAPHRAHGNVAAEVEAEAGPVESLGVSVRVRTRGRNKNKA